MLNILIKVFKRLVVYREIKTARKKSLDRVKSLSPVNILVLCYGNIYRSPLVEAYLKANLSDNYTVKSAGFHQKMGRPSEDDYIALAHSLNVNLLHHRSTIISKELTRWADVIIIMDRHNWYKMNEFDSTSINKVIWLGSFLADGPLEIQDPYGKPLEITKKLVLQMISASNKLIELIPQ